MSRLRRLLPSLLVLSAACGGSGGDAPADGSAGADGAADPAPEAGIPAAENHAHIRSQAARDILVELQRAVGEEVMDEDAGPIAADDLVAALDAAGIRRAQVLSVAYFFGFPDIPVEDEERRLREENDYVAQEVARYPDRLAGACSVNPLSDYAVDEVRRCGRELGLAGLKLHFANSDVDLRDPEHVSRVAAVFRTAAEEDLPVVAHIRTRAPDYGAQDVRVFIDRILAEAPDLPVQIAHMVGWGGYDEGTDQAFATFIEALRSGGLRRELYTFDLAAVVIPPERAEPDTAMVRQLTEANATLARRIREVGTDRVLYATDWDALPIDGYLEVVRQRLPLEEAELTDILDNVGPLFR